MPLLVNKCLQTNNTSACSDLLTLLRARHDRNNPTYGVVPNYETSLIFEQ